MSRVTVRFADGRRLIAVRRGEEIRFVLEGEQIGALSLRQAWRLAEGLDRTSTAASRPPAAPATPRARRRGR